MKFLLVEKNFFFIKDSRRKCGRKKGKGKGKKRKKRTYKKKDSGKCPQACDLPRWILWLKDKRRTPKERAKAYAEVPVCAIFLFFHNETLQKGAKNRKFEGRNKKKKSEFQRVTKINTTEFGFFEKFGFFFVRARSTDTIFQKGPSNFSSFFVDLGARIEKIRKTIENQKFFLADLNTTDF